MLQPFAKPFCAAHFPLAAALLVVVAESLRCAALAFGVGEAGARERERSVAENSLSGRGTGPSRKAGVPGLLLHGSWRAPISSVTNAELFGHAAFWRGAVGVTRFLS